jgi:integrase
LWLDRCALLVEQGEMERSTTNQYRSHLDHIARSSIAETKLARLTTPTVNAFCDELLRNGMSLATARKVLASLKTIISGAQDRGHVAQNVATSVRFKRADRREEMAIPSKDEVRAILDHAGRWRPLLIPAALTGLRASELRGLMWTDVDLDNQVLHVRRRADFLGKLGAPKSRAGTRTVPPPSPTATRKGKAVPHPPGARPTLGKPRPAQGVDRNWEPANP